MAKPLTFDKEITKKRIIEAIEDVESEIDGAGRVSEAGLRTDDDFRRDQQKPAAIGAAPAGPDSSGCRDRRVFQHRR